MLFEEELITQDKVYVINENSEKDCITEKSFIKISAKATFNDAKKINDLITELNDLTEAFAYITSGDFQGINPEQKSKTTSKGFQASKQNSSNPSYKNIAKKNGLSLDDTYIKHLSRLITYGFQNQIEVQQKIDQSLYSSILKRECLRESKEILIKKYSRKTERNLVVFGIITQSSQGNNLDELKLEKNNHYGNVKEVMMYLIENLANFEQSFSGKMLNETVIDPIAIYTEL